MPKPFNKPWLDYPAQVDLLQSRGLLVEDREAAEDFLSHVNYYRLSGYCVAFENGARHTFVPGSTFEQIRRVYEFDFDLRDLLCEALEVVEVDVRTTVAHYFGQAYGPFGHTDSVNFFQPPVRPPHKLTHPARSVFAHKNWLDGLHREIKRSKELFVAHFRAAYSDFPDLPLWVATEVMSFGTLSQMCEGMHIHDQRVIAAHYGVQRAILLSWSHHLTVVRNHCAHHGRIWDRLWSVKPELPAGKAWLMPFLPDNRRVSSTILILYQLLKQCPSAEAFMNRWRERVNDLLAKPPEAPRAFWNMGLTQEWASNPIWQ